MMWWKCIWKNYSLFLLTQKLAVTQWSSRCKTKRKQSLHNLLHFHHHRIKEDHKSVQKSENTIILLLFKLQLFSPGLFLNVILSLSCNPPHTGIWRLIYSKSCLLLTCIYDSKKRLCKKTLFSKIFMWGDL